MAILESFGLRVISQRGSYAKLRHETSDGTSQTLTVRLHREIEHGTTRATFRQASAYIPESDLRPHFYTE